MPLTSELLRLLVEILEPVLGSIEDRNYYFSQAFQGDPISHRIPADTSSDSRRYANLLLRKLDSDPNRRTADGRDSRVVYLTVIAEERNGELAEALAPIIAQLSGTDQPATADRSASTPPAPPTTLPSPPRTGTVDDRTARQPLSKSRLYFGENNSWIERNQVVRERNLILFVHGYTGSPDATWQKFPDLLLRADQGFYDGYEVGSFGYDTNLIANRETLAKLSAQLATWLTAHAAGVENIFLVTHSLGGIVARALLVDVCEDPRRSALYAQIRQVHFIASPQEGAPLPSAIARWLRFFNPLAWELRRDSPLLADLLDRWLAFAERAQALGTPLPKLYHYLGSQDWVASYERFEEGRLYRAEDFEVVPSDHTTLVKPLTTSNTVYTLVTDRIRKQGGAGAPATVTVGRPVATPTLTASSPDTDPAARPTAPDAAAIDVAVDLLAAQSASESARRALLSAAFFGHRLLDGIEYAGNANDFARHVTDRLWQFGDITPGEPALKHLLIVLRGRYGVDKQARIDDIVGRLWP